MADQVNISPAPETAVTIVEEPALPELNERETLWLGHYIACGFNATEAAERAFDYVHATAMTMGYRIKHRPHVQLHIKARVADLGVTKERIAANLAAVANADWADMTQIKTRQGVVIDARMDLTSLVKANELLGKELGMFTEKVDLDVSFVPLRLVGVDIDRL